MRLPALRRAASARTRSSAKSALAEDLARWRRGEPVLASRPSAAYRAWRWAARRKVVVLPVVALVVALAATGLLSWQKRKLTEEVLASLRATARTSVEGALLVRRSGGKMSEARDLFLPALQEAAASVTRHAPGLAEPHYHMGRMYRALMKFKEAEAAQDEALAKEPDYAPSLYERAVMRAMDYRARLQMLRGQWAMAEGVRLSASGALAKGGGGEGKMRPMLAEDELVVGDPEAGRIRAEIAADVGRLEGAPAAASAATLSPARRTVARAFALKARSWAKSDQEQARALFAHANAEDPGLEEGVQACAEAAESWDERVEVYSRAIDADKGYLPFLLGRGGARSNWGGAARSAEYSVGFALSNAAHPSYNQHQQREGPTRGRHPGQ